MIYKHLIMAWISLFGSFSVLKISLGWTLIQGEINDFRKYLEILKTVSLVQQEVPYFQENEKWPSPKAERLSTFNHSPQAVRCPLTVFSILQRNSRKF